jgi:hypothetical protein
MEAKTYKILQRGKHGKTLESGKDVIHVEFNNHSFTTSNPKEIKVMDAILEREKDVAVNSKTFLSEIEYDSVATGESNFIKYKDISLHVSQVEKIVDYAIEKGFELDSLGKKIVVDKGKGTVVKGTMTGANMKT